MASAVLFERHAFDLTVRPRIVPKELSTGSVVRKCFVRNGFRDPPGLVMAPGLVREWHRNIRSAPPCNANGSVPPTRDRPRSRAKLRCVSQLGLGDIGHKTAETFVEVQGAPRQRVMRMDESKKAPETYDGINDAARRFWIMR
jgi:hypothetical protein